MKKTLTISTLFALVFGILSFAGTNVTRADDTCTLSAADFTQIQAIQNDPSLTANQELTKELALRRQLLAQTITCAQGEAESLQTQLNSISVTGSATNIQAELSGKLDDTLTFYNLESAKLGGTGISGTEAIAREIIAWREANSTPLGNDIENFILWSQNQGLFQTAADRLSRTTQIVGFIESAAQNDTLQAALQSAQSSLENAENQNNAAETALTEFLPSDQSLALIQQSLQSLADTYQNFSTLNGLIQTLLPTSQ